MLYIQRAIHTHGSQPVRRKRDHAVVREPTLGDPDDPTVAGRYGVDFRVGRNGRFEWTTDGADDCIQFMPGHHARSYRGHRTIAATDVTGSVRIAQDGSGNIELREIGGDVLIVDDGSGDIVVEGAGGSFAVPSDGSGSIRFRDVSGSVDVPRD